MKKLASKAIKRIKSEWRVIWPKQIRSKEEIEHGISERVRRTVELGHNSHPE